MRCSCSLGTWRLQLPRLCSDWAGLAQVFVMSHSWGDNVFRNFLMWACEDEEDWVEQHIAHYANIAGPTLGVPKSVSSFLSGAHRTCASSSGRQADQ